MKIHRLSLFAKHVFLLALWQCNLGFQLCARKVIADTQSFTLSRNISLVFIALLNYFVLELLFNSYERNKSSRISDILPENILQEEENVNFQQLGEKSKNVSEIDMIENGRLPKKYIRNVLMSENAYFFYSKGVCRNR